MKRGYILFVAVGVSVLIFSSCAGAIIPLYEAPPGHATTNTILLEDPDDPLNPPKAGVTYWYWEDDETDYWYYAYQVLNDALPYNFETGVGSKGHLTEIDVSYISKFSIEMGVLDGTDTADYHVVGSAGSSGGGHAWGYTEMSYAPNGIDWSQYGGAEAIHAGYEVKPQYNWVDGQTSTTSPYFEIVSLWAPGPVHAAVGGPASKSAESELVYGPAVIPEPSLYFAMVVAMLSFLSGFPRKKINN